MDRERSAAAVSVVIPALNEERVLGRCLEALAAQDFPRGELEVVVVDNGSTDRTVEIARSFSSALRLTVLERPGLKISAMRNAGVAGSSGGIVAFLDADCVAPPRWLKTALELLAKERPGVLGAHYRIPESSSWVARAWYGGLERDKQGDLAWVPAGDMIMTRAAFEAVGGFDESIQTSEDCELCERVRARGLRVLGDASVAVEHLGTPQTLGQFYRKTRWHATDGLRVFLRSLPKLTNPRPLLLVLYTLVCAAGLPAAAAWAAWTADPRPAAWFAAAWLLPAILLSARAAWTRGLWAELGGLVVLHLAFGLARAHALLKASGSVRR